MRKYTTKYGPKEFFFSSTYELQEAIKARAEKLSVAIKQAKPISSRRSEINLDGDDPSVPFGSEQNALSVLLLTIENYENSPSKHYIVDFYEQSLAIYQNQRIGAANKLLLCHALQRHYELVEADLRKRVTRYRELLKEDSEPNRLEELNIEFEINTIILPMLSTKLDGIRDAITASKACANTSLASYLANEVLLGGPKALEKLQFPTGDNYDFLRQDLDDTIAEVEAMTVKYNKMVDAESVEDIEV